MANVRVIEKLANDKRKRVAFYCRVSSKSNDQVNSFEKQVEYYQSYRFSHPEFDYVGVYADEGLSGRLHQEKREGFYDLMRDCKAGLIDRILVKSISRFSRNTVIGLDALKQLKVLGISVFFESDGIDTEIINSDVLITMMNYVSQAESIKISESCRWGFIRRFENGHYRHSNAPYGYRLVNNGELKVDEEQAKVIKIIYEMVKNGWSIYKVANYLNNEKIPTPRMAKEWRRDRITSMLRNERYIGDMLLQKYVSLNHGEQKKRNKNLVNQYYIQDTHSPIIDKETFEVVNNIIDAKKIKFNRNIEENNNYLLSKKIKCKNCNTTLNRRVTAKGKSYEVIKWECLNHYKSLAVCDVKQVREDVIMQYINEFINEIKARNCELLVNYRDELVDDSFLKDDSRYQELKKGIANIKKQKAILDVQTSSRTSAFIMAQKRDLRVKEQKIQQELDKFHNNVNQYDVGQTQMAIQFLQDNEVLQEHKVNEFIKKFIKKIYLDDKSIDFKLIGNFMRGYIRYDRRKS